MKQLEDEEAKKLNKERKKVKKVISYEEDEYESEIETYALNDQKSCFKFKTIFGIVKTNGFPVRNIYPNKKSHISDQIKEFTFRN
ncbi:hypothetical protein BpHYR1_053045 [Brachionus plicatilis]|uniref:Uncharacterized protein n=1 Tax=Brachionus plicatilis TaxID=10195 RepID=A0A3M7T0Q6_BRAPC|nr:hypothetical protein BpHYR1_053045 [Brachionus plicatilis]